MNIIPLFLTLDNVLVDEDGAAIFDIYNYLTPNEWYLLQHVGETVYTEHKETGELYEINVEWVNKIPF